jgi:2-haloacid dehalogenase
MLKGDIPENVELLYSLKGKYELYGLTNWSAETISVAHRKYPFLSEFQGIVVSGEEKLVKPDRRIFELILNRYKLDPLETVFVDDNILNIEVAKQLGLTSVHCESPDGLKDKLLNLKVI